MDEHRKYLEEQYKILKAAEQAVRLQGQRLETLAEAVQPHLQARWGAFAQGAAPAASERPQDISTVTVAARTNLPVPPIYRGSSKKDKREFMDSYEIACIEQGTMVRICGFKLFKEEKDVTETEWRDYFLSARVPDNTGYKTLDREVKSLCVDTELQDAESRISRLMAEFYEIIDRLNMEDVDAHRAEKVVEHLVDALRPHSFKAAVKDQLSRQIHKITKSNLASFLKWLRGELEDFMRFKAHISAQHPVKGNAKPKQQQNQAKRGTGGPQGVGKTNSTHEQQTEAKKLYEATTGKKVLKPVLAVAQPKNATPRSTTTISCVVMDTLETEITPDSAAEVSMVKNNLLNQLVAEGTWIKYQEIVGKAEVTGVGEKPVQVKSKVQIDLKFSTPGGVLVLRNVTCWVTECGLPPGVGDLLLSRWIMEHLGYSPEKLLAAAQQVCAEWDMKDVDDRSASGIASILAYSGASQTPVITEEERVLAEDEHRACFPDCTSEIDAEREEKRIIILEKVDEALRVGAIAEFCEELKTILMKFIDVFRIIIGRDPPVDMPPMEVPLKPGAVPVRCKARRYSPVHRAFLKKHIDALISAGAHRMTVDVRGPNAWVESIVWPMPILETVFEQLRGSSRYFSLDFFKSFWQFAMAVLCQEIYSSLTEEGVITPTRVLMGGTNSVAYVQSTVQQMFDELFLLQNQPRAS
ncbi:unnamed protein product [Phytophthora lilii]|uniref:Unnamed protein product n=1 Tax=Phytophthora lilii TaxID=2077276 RepID=A0A9W6UDU3_9STRA|nr:unnamed protein product [Phytophthora lilii]